MAETLLAETETETETETVKAVVVVAEVDLELVSSAMKKVTWLEIALTLAEMSDVEAEVAVATAISVISPVTWLVNVLTQIRDHLDDRWNVTSAIKKATLRETVPMQATMTEVVVEEGMRVAAGDVLALNAMKKATCPEIVQMEAAMIEVVVEAVEAVVVTELALNAMKKATCLVIVRMATEGEIPTNVLAERLTTVATQEGTTTPAEMEEIKIQEALGVAATIREEVPVVVPGETEEQQLKEETGTLDQERRVAGVTSESRRTNLRKLKLNCNPNTIQQLSDLELDLTFYLTKLKTKKLFIIILLVINWI